MPSQDQRRNNRVGGHAPFWPPTYSHLRNHELCFLEQLGHGEYRIVWRDGRQSGVFSGYETWKALLSCFGYGIDCFMGELGVDGTGFPWLADAIKDPHAKVQCSKNGGVTSIAVRVGKLQLSVGSLSQWREDWYEHEPCELLEAIFEVCVLTQSGSCVTPGAMGTAVLHRNWKRVGPKYPKVSRPGPQLLKKLKEYAIAGRVESFEGRKWFHAFELDLRSAYASCCSQIPWGTARRIIHRPDPASVSQKYATWFCECTVTIVRKLLISPIPIKVKGRWTWVKNPGVYTTWLWREEVEAAIRAGVLIEVKEGWGWKRLSNRLLPWVAEMEGYRSSLEAMSRPLLAGFIKRGTVAAIGWLGILPVRYSLEAMYQKGDLPLADKKGKAPISKWSMRPKECADSAAPNHIHTYIMMKCRLKVYERELEELWDGNEIARVNFDAIYVVRSSRLPIGRGIGQWKQEERHATTEGGLFPRQRWMVSREKVVLPGLPRKSPKRLELLAAATAGMMLPISALDVGDPSVSVVVSVPSSAAP